MIEVEVYLPGEAEPTDLDGFADHILGRLALEEPLQIAETFVLDIPALRSRLEIKSTG